MLCAFRRHVDAAGHAGVADGPDNAGFECVGHHAELGPYAGNCQFRKFGSGVIGLALKVVQSFLIAVLLIIARCEPGIGEGPEPARLIQITDRTTTGSVHGISVMLGRRDRVAV